MTAVSVESVIDYMYDKLQNVTTKLTDCQNNAKSGDVDSSAESYEFWVFMIKATFI